jgi:hypothetical protein
MKENMLTQSGKDLWTRVNIEHGSSTWGYVGDGIIAIEKEILQKISDEIETLDIKISIEENPRQPFDNEKTIKVVQRICAEYIRNQK